MKYYIGPIFFVLGWIAMLVLVIEFRIIHWAVFLPPLAGLAAMIFIPLNDTKGVCKGGGAGCCIRPCNNPSKRRKV